MSTSRDVLTTSGFSLMVAFRRSGWQWPLGDYDMVRIYSGAQLVAEVPGAFVVEVLRHYVLGATLQARMLEHVAATSERPTLPIGATPPRGPRLARTTRRRLRGLDHSPPT